MHHEPLSQFTKGEVVLLCNWAFVGNVTNDSAAACSNRTWFSICSSRTSMGTCRDGTAGSVATLSEEEAQVGVTVVRGSNKMPAMLPIATAIPTYQRKGPASQINQSGRF